MIWRDHKRMAARMAEEFDLPREALIEGAVEPDRRRTLTHTWPKARRTTRSALYRARRAFLQGNLKRAARFLGIVSHYIADGMVHETIDTFHKAKEHSRIEDELGGMVEVAALPNVDLGEEGLADGEFVFGEIDALVREGLDRERLGRALSLLGSAVTGPTEAPSELVATRDDFIRRINHSRFKILGLAAGTPGVFRFLARYGWLPAAGGLVALIDAWFSLPYLVLTGLLAAISIYLASVPDLSRLSEKWYKINNSEG